LTPKENNSSPPPPLHPIERALLRALSSTDESKDRWVHIEAASQRSGASIDQTRRAVEWLKEKGFVASRDEEEKCFSLGREGGRIVAAGLPERRLVSLLERNNGICDIPSLKREMGEEFSFSLGKSKKNGWVSMEGSSVRLLPAAASKEREEQLLEKLATKGPLESNQFSAIELDTATDLIKRIPGLIDEKRQKEIFVKLTELGRGLSFDSTVEDEIEAITPKILASGEWRNKPVRTMDVTSAAPNIFAGRKHPMRQFMDEVREVYVSLGFEEILGPNVQSAFWNFDALFIPQKHSAREMQDTFYLRDAKSNLETLRSEVASVKSSHEHGADTGSSGWQYSWNEEEAARVLLRTHTTAVTINYLARYKPEEARVFSVGKVFRNEKPNYKHNPEFSQMEGVMVGKDINLRNLIYIISKFYSKLGFDKIKFWPTYFPYTEPSLQTMVFYEPLQNWMELGGMGVFRPEVTLPLGVKNPVLAWGLGLDRLVMLRHGVKDIRQLFGANIGWLRNLRLP